MKLGGTLFGLIAALVASLELFSAPLNNDLPADFPYSETVSVVSDDYGVPYIRTDRTEQLFFTLGYVHARDRLFQMHVLRLSAQGRLSEVLGERGLRHDKKMRALELARVAGRQLERLPQSNRDQLKAYSRGVNYYMKRMLMPHPAVAFFGEFPEWKPIHSLMLSKQMQFNLTSDSGDTEAISELREEDGPSRAAELLSRQMNALDYQLNAEDASSGMGQFSEYARELDWGSFGASDSPAGSNAVVISPERSASGGAILANDPHLAMRFPATWYEVDYELAGEFRAHGFTLPGVPYLSMGTTGQHAWGITVLGGDQADIYWLPREGNRYRLFGEWRRFRVERESFDYLSVGASEPVTEEQWHTEIGPVTKKEDDYVLVRRWVGAHPGKNSGGFYSLLTADSLAQFRRATNRIPYSINILYADREGNIAHFAAGRHPLRRFDGRKIVDGSRPEHDWLGYVPGEDLPYSINPDSGYLVSCNQPLLDDGVADAVLQGDRDLGLRAVAIRAELRMDFEDGPASWRDAHAAITSSYGPLSDRLARRWAKMISASSGLDRVEQSALEELRGWDGRADLDSTGATVFNMLYSEVRRATVAEYPVVNRDRIFWRIAEGEMPGWFWGKETGERETVRSEFREAVGRLRERLGPDPERWNWRRIHLMDKTHPFPLYRGKSPGMIPTPGQQDSPNLGKYSTRSDHFRHYHGPNLRQVVDMSAPFETYRSVLPGGQSGNPFSEHFADQLGMFAESELKPLAEVWDGDGGRRDEGGPDTADPVQRGAGS